MKYWNSTKIALYALFFTVKITAQPAWTWQKSVGQQHNIEKISKVIANREGKIVAVGNVKNKKQGIYFGVFDPNMGSVLHETMVKSSGVSVNTILQAISDDGYLLLGSTHNEKGWLGKTDKNGIIIWEEIYNDISELTEATIVKNELNNEHIYAIGSHKKTHFVIKIDKTGKKYWQTLFSENEDAKAKAIGTLPDGKIVVVGYEKSSMGSYRSLLNWFDTEGGLIQSQTAHNAVAMSLIISLEGDIYVAGVDFSVKNGENMLLLRFKKGDKTVERFGFGDTGTDAAFSLTQSPDGAIYLGGYSTKKRSARGGDICIVKTNNIGKNIWQQPLFLNKTSSNVHSIISLPNGKTIVAAGEVDAGAWIGQFMDKNIAISDVTLSPKNDTPNSIPSTQDKIQNPLDRISVYWTGAPTREPATGKYRIHAFAVSTQPIPKENFKYFINGKKMDSGAKFERVALIDSAKNGSEYTYNWRFDVPKNLGMNKVEVEVSNSVGIKKTEAALVVYNSESNMMLHVLSIGVPSNLAFTTRDALDFAKIWESQRGVTFTDVKTSILNTPESTKQIPIAKAIEDLKNKYISGEISKDDWIVVFISSHGFTLSNDSTNFRIAASDYEERYESSTSLNFKDNIWDVLKQIECKKLVFIDACQSGAIVNRAMASAKSDATEQNLLLNDMIDKMIKTQPNLWCVASSSGKQFSWEDATWQNGAFTEALIDAFQNKTVETVRGKMQADTDSDTILTFSEMLNFIRLRVPFLVQTVKQQLQTPRLINSDTDTDFPVFYIKN